MAEKELFAVKGGSVMSDSTQWSLQEEGIWAVVTVRRSDDGQGLYKAYAIGGNGEYLLGTLLPEGRELGLRRRLSLDELRRHGVWPVSRIEVRLAFPFRQEGGTEWTWQAGPGGACPEPAVRDRILRMGRVLVRQDKLGWTLACPFSTDKEFPLPSLFCFCRVKRLEQGLFYLFSFHTDGWPVFAS